MKILLAKRSHCSSYDHTRLPQQIGTARWLDLGRVVGVLGLGNMFFQGWWVVRSTRHPGPYKLALVYEYGSASQRVTAAEKQDSQGWLFEFSRQEE